MKQGLAPQQKNHACVITGAERVCSGRARASRMLCTGFDRETPSTRRPPQAMTVGEGMALKDVIAPELWKDFGLDENGDPNQ